ncbi:hypothetical protein [Mesobacillus subterraneus]|uniref:hypothetical protein n=1 Tax=Mesobacillus subterraneus TaxID=285983 RepID=UPI001475FE8E|nr:hypothetical protein [Mesobacillus subterraneus]
MRVFIQAKYHLHLFLKKYNEVLIEDALCHHLKSKLEQKARYHWQQAVMLQAKI